MSLERPCFYCGETLDPLSPDTYQRVTGWQRKSHMRSSGKQGGSDIYAREPVEEFAHMFCVERKRQGISALQETIA